MRYKCFINNGFGTDVLVHDCHGKEDFTKKRILLIIYIYQ